VSKKKSARLTSYSWLLLNAVVWGAALIIIKPAFAVTTPFRFLFYRYLLAVLFSLPWLIIFWEKHKKNFKKNISKILPLEILGTTIVLSLLYFGLDRTSAIEASLLTTTTPIFITLMGIFILKEKQELHESFGLAIAFIGTILLTILPVITNGGLQSISLTGNLLIIGQNLAAAFYFVLAKKHYHKMSKLFVTTISFNIGLVSFFFLSLFEAGASMTHFIQSIQVDLSHQSVWIASIYMAIFGSIIGLTAYIKGQDGIEASEASLFSYLQPLIYLPLGFIMLGEQVTLIQVTLLGLILFGVFFAEKRFSHRRLKHR